jgi:hypothetical protein
VTQQPISPMRDRRRGEHPWNSSRGIPDNRSPSAHPGRLPDAQTLSHGLDTGNGSTPQNGCQRRCWKGFGFTVPLQFRSTRFVRPRSDILDGSSMSWLRLPGSDRRGMGVCQPAPGFRGSRFTKRVDSVCIGLWTVCCAAICPAWPRKRAGNACSRLGKGSHAHDGWSSWSRTFARSASTVGSMPGMRSASVLCLGGSSSG